jgi:hypothetical protein
MIKPFFSALLLFAAFSVQAAGGAAEPAGEGYECRARIAPQEVEDLLVERPGRHSGDKVRRINGTDLQYRQHVASIQRIARAS